MTAFEDEEDTHLMTALAGGNDPALNLLIRRWSSRLCAYLERLCGCHALANDLAQETFVRVYKHRHRFRASAKFSTWLFTIATNLVRNHARWQKRHPVTLMEPEDFHDLGGASPDPPPDQTLQQREKADAVRAAILELPAEQREALVLSAYEGLSHSEIASIMDTNEKVVEMRIYRARKELRKQMEKWLGEVPSGARGTRG